MKIKKGILSPGQDVMLTRYENLYGEGDHTELVKNEQKKILGRYIFTGMIFFFAVMINIVNGILTDTEIETNKNGVLISVERPKEGKRSAVMDTRVKAVWENGQISKDLEIVIEPKNSGISNDRQEEGLIRNETREERLKRNINSMVRALNEDTKKTKVILPLELPDGTKLIWKKKTSANTFLILAAGFFVFFFLYKNRYSNIAKKEEEAKAFIIKDLPGFINKIVLLLDAGEVIHQAFEKVIEDHKKMNGDSRTYFYDQLYKIHTKTSGTNSSLHLELRTFAKRSGVREMMRFSNIISDNISKGSELVKKLKQESEVLWFARKKQAEEKGRIAETKLTFTLVILLLVLVMITIAPAMMNMS